MMCSISRSFGSYGLKSYTETSRPRTSRPKWKLSDFVLAKYSPMRETSYFSTEIMGTFGYAAPEYESTDFQESVGLTNNIWEKETAKTPKMQIYGRKESFLFIFFLLER